MAGASVAARLPLQSGYTPSEAGL